MTDYNEEQANEIEALESIYPEELEVLQREPLAIFTVSLASQNSQDDPENAASCVIQFSYTAKYPDESPLIEVTSSENLEENHINELLTVMTEQVEENLGMVMVFTLVSAAQEKLDDIVEKMKTFKEEEKERKEQELLEAEQKKFEGTRVTIETFLSWKTKFDAEIADLKRQNEKKEQEKNKKLTGKAMFMQDHTMDDSDVKFLEEEGDSVEVDESLFQDMDDLDLEDDS